MADILKRYGMTPQLYLATVDEEAPELLTALDVFAFTGYTCSPTSSRFKRLPTDGWSTTTNTARTSRWVAFRRCNSCLG